MCNTSAGALIVPEGNIRPVVSVSTQTRFNRYIHYNTSASRLLVPEGNIGPVVSVSTQTRFNRYILQYLCW